MSERRPPQLRPTSPAPVGVHRGLATPGGVQPVQGNAPSPIAGGGPSAWGGHAEGLRRALILPPRKPQDTVRSALSAISGTRRSIRKNAVHKYGLSLAYQPVSDDAYCLALSGALAGMMAGRIPESLFLDAYLNQTIAATVWAQTFDFIASIETPLDLVTAQLIYGESYAAWQGRNTSILTAAQCTPTINAILTSILTAEAELLALDIVPDVYRPTMNQAQASSVSTTVTNAGGLTSVLDGGLEVTSSGGIIEAIFTANPTWTSGQNDTVAGYQFYVNDVAAGSFFEITCPTASAYGTGLTLQYANNGRIEAGRTVVLDVKATTTAGGTSFSSLQNLLVYQEFVN